MKGNKTLFIYYLILFMMGMILNAFASTKVDEWYGFILWGLSLMILVWSGMVSCEFVKKFKKIKEN